MLCMYSVDWMWCWWLVVVMLLSMGWCGIGLLCSVVLKIDVLLNVLVSMLNWIVLK